MKQFARSLLHRLGYALRHRSADPLVVRLDHEREQLRLQPLGNAAARHALPQIALGALLRDLLALHQPDLVVDVGANRGEFTDEIRSLGYRGPMLSIEPQGGHAATLQDRAALTDPVWTVLHAAAGDAPGRLTLKKFADDRFSSLHTPNAAAQARFGAMLASAGQETVDIVRLDDVLAHPPFACARRILLKTDTQGHDLAVLRGAAANLARTGVVLSEAALVPLYDGAATPATLAALLEPHGFRSAGFFAVSHDERDLAVLELDCLFVRPPALPT